MVLGRFSTLLGTSGVNVIRHAQHCHSELMPNFVQHIIISSHAGYRLKEILKISRSRKSEQELLLLQPIGFARALAHCLTIYDSMRAGSVYAITTE